MVLNEAFGMVTQGLTMASSALNTILISPIASLLTLSVTIIQATIALVLVMILTQNNALKYPTATRIILWAGIFILLKMGGTA